MIAILYEANETDFTSNGLGGLPDAYNDEVVEKRNGSYELSFKYKISGYHFAEIKEDRIVYVSPAPGKTKQPFTIYRTVKSIDGNSITVYARHVSYYLSYIPVTPFSATGAQSALTALKTNSLLPNNFNFWSNVSTAGTFTVNEPLSLRSWLGGRTGSILDVFGGEYEWDNRTVKLWASRGNDNGVTIRYSKNLKSLEQDKNVEAVYTGTLAYWIDNNTKKVVCGNISYIANHASYPHEKILSYNATQDFQSEPSVADLTNRALAYNTANNVGVPKTSITFDFESLAQTDEYKNIAPLEYVNMCDIVHVVYDDFGVTASGKVVETHYSWTKEKYTAITIGDAVTTLSSAISNTAENAVLPKTKSFIDDAVASATKLITGGTGGHFVIGTNADGEPNETYWMDTDSVTTAQKVLRANYNGIGGSVNGINGPYGVSMTLDGHINADYVTAGTLRAITIDGVTINGSVINFGDATNYMNMSNSSQKLLFNSYGTYGMQINASGSCDITAKPISGDTSTRYAELHALNEYGEDVANITSSSSYSNGTRYGSSKMYSWARNCPHASIEAKSGSYSGGGYSIIDLRAETNDESYSAVIQGNTTNGITLVYYNPSIPANWLGLHESMITLDAQGNVNITGAHLYFNGAQKW